MATSIRILDFDANLLHKDLIFDQEHHIKTAQDNGVAYFVVPGSTLVDSEQALALSKRFPESIYATAGVHPYQTGQIEHSPESLAHLERLIKDKSCLAVGECGLDYSEGFPDRALQLPWFRSQVQMALQHSLPLYLHIRDAHEDFVAVMAEYGFSSSSSKKPPVDVCVHCYTGTTAELRHYCQELGFYVSLSGHVIRKPVELSEWLEIIPAEKLLLETDAPYMGFKGCRSTEAAKKTQNYPNVPAAAYQVAAHISAAAGISIAELAHRTTSNAHRYLKCSAAAAVESTA